VDRVGGVAERDVGALDRDTDDRGVDRGRGGAGGRGGPGGRLRPRRRRPRPAAWAGGPGASACAAAAGTASASAVASTTHRVRVWWTIVRASPSRVVVGTWAARTAAGRRQKLGGPTGPAGHRREPLEPFGHPSAPTARRSLRRPF